MMHSGSACRQALPSTFAFCLSFAFCPGHHHCLLLACCLSQAVLLLPQYPQPYCAGCSSLRSCQRDVHTEHLQHKAVGRAEHLLINGATIQRSVVTFPIKKGVTR
jgi:hypothetical protein